MSEQKVAVGVCEEVSERGEWVTFSINVGSQYTVKVNTKKDEIVQAGRAAAKASEIKAWHYNENKSDRINEKSGKPYINRYLESVTNPEGETTSSFSPKASPETGRSWGDKEEQEMWAGKEKRICRQACLKVAAEIHGALPKVNPDEDAVVTVIRAAERLENWVYRGFDQPPFD